MCLLAYEVPVLDIKWDPMSSRALLEEVKLLPGLKKAHFAMPSRWLKSADRITTDYSTVTFVISDPDGTISSKLIQGRVALFGKKAEIQWWVEKPALVQCSHCHSLGHIKTSRACPLGKNSVRCYICSKAHQLEMHDYMCPWKHEFVGTCNCMHFKCLNCQKTRHHCWNTQCLAWDLFRPKAKRQRKLKHNSKEKEVDKPGCMPPDQATDDLSNNEDLYMPITSPPRPASW